MVFRQLVLCVFLSIAACGGGSGAGGDCPDSQKDCSGQCVDTERDSTNCGACGNACESGQACSAGECVRFCGEFGNTSCVDCEHDLTSCNGTCVDLDTNPGFCGDCRTQCADGEACNGGECVDNPCEAGTRFCGDGICADLNSDPNHCGSCAIACGDDEVCESGECVNACGEGAMRCNDTCTNTSTNVNACGACDNVCDSGDACHGGRCVGAPNGFAVIDRWGEAWDGLQRGPATWAAANADCLAARGRLPTMTELYRNRATNGPSDIAAKGDTSPLWTLIAASPNQATTATVRLSDGIVDTPESTTAQFYRCVWRDKQNDAFSGDNCSGQPDEECQPYGLIWNADTETRAVAPYAAAINECHYYDGTLVPAHDAQTLAQFGWRNPDGADLHTLGNHIFNLPSSPTPYASMSSEHRCATVRDTQGNPCPAVFDDRPAAFRCVGKRSARHGVAPTCPGGTAFGCFESSVGRHKLVADVGDRPALPWAAALADCHSLGATLPNREDVAALIHAGWVRTTQSNRIWIASYGTATNPLTIKWRDAGPAVVPQFQAISASIASPYRCVWKEKLEAAPTVCAGNQNQVWNGTSFACVASTAGTSCANNECGAVPNGAEISDAWGNAWDQVDRVPADFATAAQACTDLGGRLPTVSELYRVGSHQTTTRPIGSSVSPLWTLAPAHQANMQVTIRLSDARIGRSNHSTATAYRCVWPSTRGNVLDKVSCVGNPADGSCVQTAGFRYDREDRPALSQPSAAWECAFAGGRLPTASEKGQFFPNPSGWLSEAASEDRSQGGSRRTWTRYYGMIPNFDASDRLPFRCVFSATHP